ncbi:Homeodomain-like protein [Limtongia smithiae]|uniref:Homeodomain-like protein n=1 Tax=Limtongia smithiae TaxID=1125753 RepID=UPI0034CD8635
MMTTLPFASIYSLPAHFFLLFTMALYPPTPQMALDTQAAPARRGLLTPVAALLIPSPPPSPFIDDGKSADPPLFAPSAATTPALPLFQPLRDLVARDTPDPCFESVVYHAYTKAPRRWLHTQLAQMRRYKTQYEALLAAANAPVATVTSSPVVAPRTTARVSKASSRPAVSPRPPRTPKTAPRSPIARSPAAFVVPRDAPAASPASTVHDIDTDNVPDFSPPLSSLDSSKGMRTDWKGTPMDLDADPDRHLLHPHELQLASVLRLPCAVYLDSKKRIFAERVFRARKGLQFRRTDSQKACRIDVNKATRLFVAFERVGWFDDKWLAPYML